MNIESAHSILIHHMYYIGVLIVGLEFINKRASFKFLAQCYYDILETHLLL